MHSDVEAAENVPIAHSSHEEAPLSARVLVMEPAAHRTAGAVPPAHAEPAAQ